ncbi:MAG TPA: pectinesterase family protein, partial [Chitinophagaceae bacterium]
MIRNTLTIWLYCVLSFCCFLQCAASRPEAENGKRIIVSLDGKGNFRSIQAALNSLPDSAALPTTIFIKKGLYKEKIYIEKHNVKLEGEDRSKTIICQSIARDQWRCLHNDDWGVATVNVDGNDVTFENLTIINNYGSEVTRE